MENLYIAWMMKDPYLNQWDKSTSVLRFFLAMQVKRCLRKGWQMYAIEAVSEEDGPSLDQYHVFLEFPGCVYQRITWSTT